jgi:hypothetical protein
VRFAALKSKLSHRPGVSNPGALAGYIGTPHRLCSSLIALIYGAKNTATRRWRR